MSYARKLSENSMPYKNSLPSFNGQCAICTDEQCFVLKEKVDTSKVKALDYCFTNWICK